MFDFMVPASIDSPSGFDVGVQVTGSPTVFPDHAQFVTVRLTWEKAVIAEELRVPAAQRDVEASIERLARRVEPQLARERARRMKARGYA